MWTFDPRNTARDRPAYVPFDLWPKQAEYLRWLCDRVAAREEGVCEKSRDVGLSWLNVAFAAHRWLYVPGFKTTFGANKADNVDKIGDPDSLLEKARILLRYLPKWMLPPGWDPARHDNFMRLVNPHYNNIIDGESGDNMGRGGRSTVYIIDEAAHVERAQRVDASTLATADCRIWVSSVNGMGNVFARKRHSGVVPVFRLHFRDDPRKDAEWETQMRARTEPHTFAAEYDIDYSASVEGLVIPGAWVAAAREIGKLINIPPGPVTIAGQDVGGGKAKSVFVARSGPVVHMPVFWSDPNTTNTAYRAIEEAQRAKARLLNYDPIGVGSGVTSTIENGRDDHPAGLKIQGVNTGDNPSEWRVWPDGKKSSERFINLRAELWWLARDAFHRTFQHSMFLKGEDGGVEHPTSDLISLPDCNELVVQLSSVKWFRNEKGRIQIESKKQMATRGIQSPDFADALILTYDDDVAEPVRGDQFDVQERDTAPGWQGDVTGDIHGETWDGQAW